VTVSQPMIYSQSCFAAQNRKQGHPLNKLETPQLAFLRGTLRPNCTDGPAAQPAGTVTPSKETGAIAKPLLLAITTELSQSL